MSGRTLIALRADAEDGGVVLRSPSVGLWRGAPAAGTLVAPGARLGELEILGERVALVVPSGVHGVVTEVGGLRLARRPLQHGDLLVALSAEVAIAGSAGAIAGATGATGLIFAAPSSGRFYGRPSPDKPAFAPAGSEVGEGDTVCLLEVMKTFNRIGYGGDGLPPRARIVRVVPGDGDDLEAGDPILELEPA